MDARQEKGLILAKDKRIRRIAGETWGVPSQSQEASGYLENLATGHCFCPDYETRRVKSKHQWAVEIVKTVETAADGTQVVTESVKVTRKTYSQDWPAYNAAQCAEKETMQALLRGLCDGVSTPAHPGRGPKPIPYSDAIFGMAMKVWSTVSARRATTDIKALAKDGKISRAPHFNSVLNYFDNPAMPPILPRLIEQSAAPLAGVETAFAVESTGFGTTVYRRWFDHKYGREMSEQTWVRATAMVGTKISSPP